jgi:FkbM family methyltransferase
MHFANVSGHTIYLPILPCKNPVVLDLGGNNGAFADWALNTFAAKVYAVEALPELAEALSRDTRLTVMHAAVGSQTGTTTIFRSPNRCASVHLNERDTANAVDIPAISFEDLCRRWKLDQLDLVKIDIEGSELDLLEKTPIAILKSIGQITVEFHDFMEKSHRPAIRRICRRLEDAGFLMVPMAVTTYGDTLFINRSRLAVPALTYCECLVHKYSAAGGRLLRRLTPKASKTN